jgi:hypothetical protein
VKATAITKLPAGTEVAYVWSRGHDLGDSFGLFRAVLLAPEPARGDGRNAEWAAASRADVMHLRSWQILGTWTEHKAAYAEREARDAAERAENEHHAARRRRWAEHRLDRLAALGIDRDGIAVNHATLRVTFAPKDLARLLELAEAGATHLTPEGT